MENSATLTLVDSSESLLNIVIKGKILMSKIVRSNVAPGGLKCTYFLLQKTVLQEMIMIETVVCSDASKSFKLVVVKEV